MRKYPGVGNPKTIRPGCLPVSTLCLMLGCHMLAACLGLRPTGRLMCQVRASLRTRGALSSCPRFRPVDCMTSVNQPPHWQQGQLIGSVKLAPKRPHVRVRSFSPTHELVLASRGRIQCALYMRLKFVHPKIHWHPSTIHSHTYPVSVTQAHFKCFPPLGADGL